MRLRHYALIHSDTDQIDWDQLRDDPTEPSYHVPASRGEYLQKVGAAAPNAATGQIAAFMAARGMTTVLSVGCGIGWLEYQLLDPGRRVIVTDVTESVDRLNGFDVFDQAFRFDVLVDELPVADVDLVVLSRVDTEFTDEQLAQVFARLRRQGVAHVCVVATCLLGWRQGAAELRTLAKARTSDRKRVFCGYFRDFRGLAKAWQGSYRVVSEDRAVPIFFLEAV